MMIVASILVLVLFVSATIIGLVYYKKIKRLNQKIKKLKDDPRHWIE